MKSYFWKKSWLMWSILQHFKVQLYIAFQNILILWQDIRFFCQMLMGVPIKVIDLHLVNSNLMCCVTKKKHSEASVNLINVPNKRYTIYVQDLFHLHEKYFQRKRDINLDKSAKCNAKCCFFWQVDNM